MESLDALKEIGFDGYALGGLAVGETQKQMFKVLKDIVPFMPKNKPRYLMGVGTPSDILGAVKIGIDMFETSPFAPSPLLIKSTNSIP